MIFVDRVGIGLPSNNAREAASAPESWLNLFALLTPVFDQLMSPTQLYEG